MSVESGGKLQTIAGLIPEPPATFSPPGGDALSTAIAGKVAEVVDPVVAQMPITKDALTRYAQNVMNAADKYDITDRQIAEEILKRLGLFDEAAGAGSSGSAGGGAGAAAGRRARPRRRLGLRAAGQQAASAGQQAGQMGQMMQMPMQMAQQAAQIPMQLAGMAAAIPQAMMQGVQSAVQQAGQLSEMTGEDEEKLEGEDPQTAERGARGATRRQDAGASDPIRPRPETPAGERAPDAAAGESHPETPAAPKPAPTRPAESAPEIAL